MHIRTANINTLTYISILIKTIPNAINSRTDTKTLLDPYNFLLALLSNKNKYHIDLGITDYRQI